MILVTTFLVACKAPFHVERPIPLIIIQGLHYRRREEGPGAEMSIVLMCNFQLKPTDGQTD